MDGVVVITGKGRLAKRTLDGKVVPAGQKQFTAIPYYAWAHRGTGEMDVWLARNDEPINAVLKAQQRKEREKEKKAKEKKEREEKRKKDRERKK